MLFQPTAPESAIGWRLVPEKDVEDIDGRLVATSADPWMTLEPTGPWTMQGWVRLRYSASLFDDPVRPLIRFTDADGRPAMHPLNGPVLGSAEWIGRVPDGTRTISLSPVGTAGPFGFRVECVEAVPRAMLVQRGLARDPGALMVSLGAKIINAREERWEMLKFASSATRLSDYHHWHGRLARAPEPESLDLPRTDWERTPAVRLLMALDETSAESLHDTLLSAATQAYERWTLHALADARTPAKALDVFHAAAGRDPRLRLMRPDTLVSALAGDLAGNDAVTVIGAGDRLTDHALAILAETLAKVPKARIAYGDEDAIGIDGRLHSPQFKPGWSPTWYGTASYLGRLTAVRAANLAEADISATDLLRDEDKAIRRIAERVPPDSVLHIRRILYRRSAIAPTPATSSTAPPERWPARAVSATANALPEATIVIPSRDRPDLIGACMETLRTHTDYPAYRIVIVDNGSVQQRTIKLLRELGARPNVEVIARPGPFNYSALCNEGARRTDTPLLVFLNNDVTVFEAGWLKALAGWAVQPAVGVVGAKLLFPNQTLEHAGVVVGHGGLAGHLYEGQPMTEPGPLGRLLAPHEVSAVTGACIAIERVKFEAVGGFDAENLPVDLNDIDLCLKAAERGWRTIWTPEAVLYHRQSATRGYALKPFTLYRKEREHFRQRWAHVIRDDPYFHPALSLFAYEPALG